MLPKIDYELCEIYGLTILEDGKVQEWCQEFNMGCTVVHDDERIGEV